LRIVAGRWAGVDLTSPAGRVRPTAEELRDEWLTFLQAELPGARVLDLFAGSGALGLEALSRGAASADFVENGRAALHALKANIARLRASRITRVFTRDALTFIDDLPADSYHLVLADPPYASTLGARVAERWLRDPFSTILCVEHAAGHSLPPGGTDRRYGDTAVTMYRARHKSAGRGLAARSPRSSR
jgi:16S rRNA (guanine966-N2)-methyltransferase